MVSCGFHGCQQDCVLPIHHRCRYERLLIPPDYALEPESWRDQTCPFQWTVRSSESVESGLFGRRAICSWMREAVLKLTMDYKMTKHLLNNGTLNESRTWLLVRTWHCYFISFNNEHPVRTTPPWLLWHCFWRTHHCTRRTTTRESAETSGYTYLLQGRHLGHQPTDWDKNWDGTHLRPDADYTNYTSFTG